MTDLKPNDPAGELMAEMFRAMGHPVVDVTSNTRADPAPGDDIQDHHVEALGKVALAAVEGCDELKKQLAAAHAEIERLKGTVFQGILLDQLAGVLRELWTTLDRPGNSVDAMAILKAHEALAAYEQHRNGGGEG